MAIRSDEITSIIKSSIDPDNPRHLQKVTRTI